VRHAGTATALLLLAVPSSAGAAGAAGLALGAGAVQVASGDHELRPLGGLWGRLGLGPACFLEAGVDATRRLDDGDVVRLDERWARGALTAGCSAGRQALRVAVAVGPALTWRDTRVAGEEAWRATALQAGVRYRAGLLLPLGGSWEADLLFGGSTRGGDHDQELVLQVGVRW